MQPDWIYFDFASYIHLKDNLKFSTFLEIFSSIPSHLGHDETRWHNFHMPYVVQPAHDSDPSNIEDIQFVWKSQSDRFAVIGPKMIIVTKG